MFYINFISHFSSIGNLILQVVAKHEGDLVLKFDYKNKKIYWEVVRQGPSRHKIEVDWSNIIGIEAAIEDHRQGILQLEVLKFSYCFSKLLRLWV